MFAAIYTFELMSWLRRPGFYLLAGVFFVLPLTLFIGTAGYFDAEKAIPNESNLAINSAYQIQSFVQTIGKFMLILLPALMGATLYRDFQFGAYHLLFSYPITKSTYLRAKFLSGFTLVLLISFLSFSAFIFGEYLLGTDHPFVVASSNGYAFSYGLILFPNLLIGGLFVSCAVVLLRNRYAGFFMVLCLVIFQSIIENAFPNSTFLASLLDPLGEGPTLIQTQFWTIAEKNSLPLKATSTLIFNRLIWLIVALFITIWTYRKFSMTQFGLEYMTIQRKSGKSEYVPQTNALELVTDIQIGKGTKWEWRQLLALVKFDFRYILSHFTFIVFSLLAVLSMVFMLNRVMTSGEMIMLPYTRLILHLPTLFFSILVALGTFIFSGMIMLRTRDAHMESLINSTQVSSVMLIFSKAITIVAIGCVMLLFAITTGMSMQLINNFYHFDLIQYLTSHSLIYAPVIIIWSLLSVFVYSLTRHLYLGIFILLLAWLVQFGYEQLGISTQILQFNTYPILTSNDFDGYGPDIIGRMALQFYWLQWGLILFYISILIWPRIETSSIKEKWRHINANYPRKWNVGLMLLVSLSTILALILKAENTKFTVLESPEILEMFKKNYGHIKDTPQPRIVAVSLQMDLFPDQNTFKTKGEYIIKNKTNSSIDTLLIKTSTDEITEYLIDHGNRQVSHVPGLNFYVHALNKPLLPGDTIRLTFFIRNRDNTLLQKNSDVRKNGTFITQDILPRIGYFLGQEKEDHIEGMTVTNQYQSWDSDLVKYRATISTSLDQTALSNGRLIKNWQADERNYFSFETDDSIKFNFHINSGIYKKYTDRWNDTPITIFHHPDHTHNLVSIIAGVKSALDFNNRLLGCVPSDELRVIEYPLTDGTFSTLKTGNIVMSESVFGVKTSAKKVNMPFYIAAHEMTHHWFGNKLIPGDVAGALLLTESITEYLTLQIIKEHFGEKMAYEFLRIQEQRYFKGLSMADQKEPCLYVVKSGQEYVSYGKGSIALHAIGESMGHDKFQTILSTFFRQFTSSKTYTTSNHFIQMLKQNASIGSSQLIDEWLLRSVIYENEITSAVLERNEQTDWKISIDYSIKAFEHGKIVTEHNGRSIQIGVYDENGSLLLLKTLEPDKQNKVLIVRTNSKPHQLILDPLYLTLDKNRKNNSHTLE